MSAASLDQFLAYSVELEREAQERYTELADAMAAHHNHEVAAFFADVAEEAGRHLAEVDALTQGRKLPDLAAWEFDWPRVEPPETTSYEAVHYRMSLAEAIRLALDSEEAAEHYYRSWSQRSSDAEVRRLAAAFADEEARHARTLRDLLDAQPETTGLHRVEDDQPVQPE